MEKITVIKMTDPLTNEVTEHVIIDKGNEEFTSMSKAVYDQMLANQNYVIALKSNTNAIEEIPAE